LISDAYGEECGIVRKHLIFIILVFFDGKVKSIDANRWKPAKMFKTMLEMAFWKKSVAISIDSIYHYLG